MQSVELVSPEELARTLAERAQVRRLALNLTQSGLAARSGVSFGTLKHFERTGEISLVSLLRIAHTLDALQEFLSLFPALPSEFRSLDDVIRVSKGHARRRGRIR